MVVSEQEQLFASKLAYLDLDDALANCAPGRDLTLEEAIKYAYDHGKALGSLSKCVENGVLKEEYSYAKDWKILSVKNENTAGGSGLYACIIDTGDANILACRGSEEMTVLENYRQDWYGADMKLLNSQMTSQEEALREYMEANQDLLNSKPWVSTGHSLGGALADYAAVMSVVLGMDHYSGTYNFDGPGHSQEFIEKYRDEIAQVSSKMVHLKASIVGSILFDLPGVSTGYIETKNVGAIKRHSMENWLPENGCLKRREQPEALEYLVEKLTRGADRLPAHTGNAIISIINLAIEGFFWAKGFTEDHPGLAKVITVAACLYLISHLPLTMTAIHFAWTILKYVCVFLLAVIVGEIIIEALEAVIHAAIEGICKAVSWLADKAAELYQAAKEWIASVKEYLHNQTPGARYVKNNPFFRADTVLMREYANRLRAINGRLTSLDRDLDDLYWQVGLLDVYDILRSNIIAGYSPRIGLCQRYLNSAADALEDADRKALGYMGG